jgi:hypothetical protein
LKKVVQVEVTAADETAKVGLEVAGGDEEGSVVVGEAARHPLRWNVTAGSLPPKSHP